MSINWLLPLESEVLVHAVVPGESVYLGTGCLDIFVKIKKETGQEDALAELLYFWKETANHTLFPQKFPKKRKEVRCPKQKVGTKK